MATGRGQVGVTATVLSGLVSLGSTASVLLAIHQVTNFTRFQAELGPVLFLWSLCPSHLSPSPPGPLEAAVPLGLCLHS